MKMHSIPRATTDQVMAYCTRINKHALGTAT